MSLRVYGLSDSEGAIRETLQILERNTPIERILSQISGNSGRVDQILGNRKNREESPFGSSNGIFIDDDNFLKQMKSCGLRLDQTHLFENKWKGYSFRHGFILNPSQTRALSCVLLDPVVVVKTTTDLGEESFKKLEKSLTTLFMYANHDYTIHGLGLTTSNFNAPELDNNIGKSIDFLQLSNGLVDSSEILSAIFHRDILQECESIGIPIRESLFKNIDSICTYVSMIQDKDIQEYWMRVIKYPLFSIFHPDSLEIKNLHKKFPTLDFKATRWGNAVCREDVPLKNGEIIGIKDLREAVVKDLSTGKTHTPETISLLKNYSQFQKVLYNLAMSGNIVLDFLKDITSKDSWKEVLNYYFSILKKR